MTATRPAASSSSGSVATTTATAAGHHGPTADAPPIQVALVTLRSVLDTVKVLANYNRYSQLQEFSQRARSGMGRFLTAEQIAQRVPVVTSDLFTAIPGVYLEQGAMGPMLTMKGVFADRCTPAVYLNGF
ncbi:MAG: hypothetical protein RLZZ515_793, partial [Cyanobacteriota bacterium]